MGLGKSHARAVCQCTRRAGLVFARSPLGTLFAHCMRAGHN